MPDSQPKFLILRRSPLLRDATDDDLLRVASRSTLQRYANGDTVMSRGSVGEALGMVGSGRVKVTIPSPAATEGEFLAALILPGEIMGEIVVFDRRARAGGGKALAASEVLWVPASEVYALIERSPRVALRFLENFAARLRLAFNVSLSLRFLDLPSRLYQRFQWFSEMDSGVVGGHLRIQHGLSQQDLADSIGATREALNKVLSDWKRSGLIHYGRGYVVILDPTGLAQRLPPAVREREILGDALAANAGAGA